MSLPSPTGRPEPVALAGFVSAIVALAALLLHLEPAVEAAVVAVVSAGSVLWARSKVTPTEV